MSLDYLPQVEITYKEKNEKLSQIIQVADFVDTMRVRARGKRIPIDSILSFKTLEPYERPKEEKEEITHTDDNKGKNIDTKSDASEHVSIKKDTQATKPKTDNDTGSQMLLFDS